MLSKKIYFYLIIVTPLLFGCNISKYLQDDVPYVRKNYIKIDKKDRKKLMDAKNMEYKLASIAIQKPLKKIYLRKIKKSDIPKPFSERTMRESARKMQHFLQNSGYYNAKVEADFKIRKQKAKVTYRVDLHQLYTIDTVRFFSKDPVANRILQETASETFLKRGEPMSNQVYKLEVSRLTRVFRNRGYADFYPKNVDQLSGDSLNHKVNIDLEVLLPRQDNAFKIYKIGDITVYSDYYSLMDDTVRLKRSVNGITFIAKGASFFVKPEVIAKRIGFKKGDIYNQSAVDETRRVLAALGTFKFISIKQKKNENGYLDFDIYLTSHKKYLAGFGGNTDVTKEKKLVGEDVYLRLGLSLSPYITNRNVGGRAENFSFDLSPGVDLAIGKSRKTRFVNTFDLKMGGTYHFPRFLDFFGFWKKMSHGYGSIIEKGNFYELLKAKATSQFSLNFEYYDKFDYFRKLALNASFGFQVFHSKNKHYTVNHIGLTYFKPTIREEFRKIIESNPYLKRSFSRQFFTGFLIRDFSYLFAGQKNRFGESWYYKLDIEQSGAEVLAVNKIFNSFTGNHTRFRIGESSFEHYFRTNFIATYAHQFSWDQTVAVRFNTGVAFPFGYSDEVPYIKQFFAGGSQSMRAWRVRELGPGGFYDAGLADSSLLYFQTGDIKLEINGEYRFFLLRIFGAMDLNGAVFLDAGNVWTLKKDENRPGSQFLLKRRVENGKLNDNFINQMAVGTGFGLRFDFGYFLVAFDLGMKLRTPYVREDGAQWINPATWRLKQINPNIGLSYPF